MQHPAAVKPNYRRIVLSVRVETAPLLREIERVSRVDPVPNGDGWQTVRAKTALRGLYPPDGRIPEGVTIKVVRGRVADWLDFNEPRPNTGERVPPPSWDVISRIRKSQRTPSA